jgi:predicted DCC family thiol-disulfide oxidoreductase YuxK
MFKLAPFAVLVWTFLSVARVGAWTTTKSVASARSSASASSFSALAASLSSNPPLSGMDPQSSAATAAAANALSNKKKTSVVDWDWQSVAETAFADANDQRPILLFDGVCNFCNGGVNLALDLDVSDTGVLRFASLQSIVGQSLLMKANKKPNDLSTVVLVESLEKSYFESEAVMRTAELLQGLPAPVRWASKLGRNVLPGFIRNAAYQVVGRNRYLWGERETLSCRLDFDGSIQSRFVEDPEDIVQARMEQESGAAAAVAQ